MTALPRLPDNRAQLFQGFLRVLYDREREAREARHDAARLPELGDWERALAALAEAMQRKGGAALVHSVRRRRKTASIRCRHSRDKGATARH